MTRSFAGGAGLGQVELRQLPGWEGWTVQLRHDIEHDMGQNIGYYVGMI